MSCLAVACCAVIYSNASLILLFFATALLLALAMIPSGSSEVVRFLWDLDKQSLRLWCADGSCHDCLKIEKIHLLPYLFSFRVMMSSGKRISVGIFPDSVSVKEFRRLKVALKLGKMDLVSKAIRS